MEVPKNNNGRIMKSAWSMFKTGKMYRNHVLTFAECLKEAWKNERVSYNRARDIFNLRNQLTKREKVRDAKRNVSTSSMAFMADTLISYYANNRYNGD